MSNEGDFESESAAIGRDTDGPPGAYGDPAPVMDGPLTAPQVAELLHRDRRTLRNWERRGLLRPVRIGRGIYYRPSDIEALSGR